MTPEPGLGVDDGLAADADPEVLLGPSDALAVFADSFPLVVVLDAIALALAVLLGITVGFDTTLVGRGPLALVFFLWVPGWTVLRGASVPPTSMTLLASLGLSISLTFLGGQVLVAWSWSAWRIATVAVCVAVSAVLARDLERLRR